MMSWWNLLIELLFKPKPEPKPEPEPPKPDPKPDPIKIRHCNGWYLFDPGEENREISEADLRLPAVDGHTLRFRLPWVLKANGSFDWSFIDKALEKHRKVGKPYTLLCMAGDSKEPWKSENLNKYLSLIKEAGKKYGKDPLCAGWHITGCSPYDTSEELHWPNPMTDEVLEANKKLIKACAEAFPECDILIALSGKDKSGRIEKLIDYGAEIAPGRFRIKHNALKSIEIDAFHNQRIINGAKDSRVLIGWEMVGSTLEKDPKGRPRPGSKNILDAIAQGYEMARRAGEKPEDAYIAIYWPDRYQLDKNKVK